MESSEPLPLTETKNPDFVIMDVSEAPDIKITQEKQSPEESEESEELKEEEKPTPSVDHAYS